ncbi:MAG TPA: hypothetical protein VGC94_06960 [Amnibacterium sp.]
MTALTHADPAVVRGRRRETSRHRTSRSFGIPGWVAWTLRSGTPLVSLLPALVLVVLVQSLSPAAQRVPTGGARFALAGAWATTAPGAVVGYRHWFTTPVIGWLQLGALDRALLGGTGQSVLAAAHGAMLLLALAGVTLLWFVLRRAGASGIAAGAASAAFGIAPIAVAAHTVVAPVAVALVWLLISALLVLGRRGPLAAVAIGLTAGIAVLSDPVALVLVPALAWALLAPVVRAPRTLRAVGASPRSAGRPAIAAAAGFAVVVAGGTVLALVLAASEPGSAARAADAIGAAAAAQAAFPAAGAASAVAWLRTDPLSLLIGIVAVILAARSRSFVPVAAVAALTALTAFWPDGRDPVAPVVLLLPIVTLATALVIDRAILALGRPQFLTSAVGSGWLMAVVALLVVAAVVWIDALPALQTGARQPLSRAQRWVDSSVPPGQVVLVDLGLWPDLAHGARAAVGWYAAAEGAPAPSSAPWSSADYLVTTGDSLDASTGAAHATLARSLAVARFGSGPTAVDVRAVRSAPAPTPSSAPPSAAEQRAADARRQTGAELATNPRLTVDGADRALLQGGDVDTRLSIVLGQLLAVHRLTIGGFPARKGDTGTVRRQVLISAIDGHPVPHDADATGTVLRYLSALRGPYATSTIDATDAGVLATFAPDPTFVPPS